MLPDFFNKKKKTQPRVHLGKWQVKTKDRRAGRKPSVIIISPKFITNPRRSQAKYGLNVSRGYEACSGATWQEEGGSRVWGSGGDGGARGKE